MTPTPRASRPHHRSPSAAAGLAAFCLALFAVPSRALLLFPRTPSSCLQPHCSASRAGHARSLLSSQGGYLSLPAEATSPMTVLPGKVPGQASPVPGSGERSGPRGEGGGGDDDDREFKFNVGRAMDYLAFDVPLMFSAPPRLEIFTPTVVLKDPIGELCHGRRLYGALHTSLRVLGAVTAVRPRVGVTSLTFSESRREVELKWTMAASAPFVGNNAVKLSAISVYRVNDHGLIYEHSIDNRIKRDLWEYSHSWMGMLTGDRPPSA